ncbi:MAG: PEGA domain-containing protein [Vicinamibacterales bacterium]
MLSLGGWLRQPAPPPKPPELVSINADALSEFQSEDDLPFDESRTPATITALRRARASFEGGPGTRAGRGTRSWITYVAAAAALAQIPVVGLWLGQSGIDYVRGVGTVRIDASRPGVEVVVDGEVRGQTPLELTLPAGTRQIELRQGGTTRSVTLPVARGESTGRFFEFEDEPVAAAAPTARLGTLAIDTTPAGVPVLVDGVERGVSPLSLGDVPAGSHTVAVRFRTGLVERPIEIESGATASLVMTMPRLPGTLSGWVSFDTPLTLRVSENGELLGTTEVGRLMLPVGEHMLDLVNEQLGYRGQLPVQVTAGQTIVLPFTPPVAPVSINAQPWAEVWIDGERIGETPIGNLSRTIGRHEVVFRHPQLGERRESLLVTLREPARLAVDLRQPGGRAGQ